MVGSYTENLKKPTKLSKLGQGWALAQDNYSMCNIHIHDTLMHNYLLQLAVSGEVTAHEYACFLPLQHSKEEQQPHKGIIFTWVND